MSVHQVVAEWEWEWEWDGDVGWGSVEWEMGNGGDDGNSKFEIRIRICDLEFRIPKCKFANSQVRKKNKNEC